MDNTKYILLYSLLLVLLPSLLYAQEEVVEKESAPKKSLQSQHVITATLPRFGYQYEQPLSEKWLVNVSPSLGFVIFGGASSFLVLSPKINVHTRYYYSRVKRMQKGKSLALNTGHFLGFGASYDYTFDNNKLLDFENTIISIPEVFWGGRSNLGGQFFFDYSLGLVIQYTGRELVTQNNILMFLGNSNQWFVAPHIVLNFGYVFK